MNKYGEEEREHLLELLCEAVNESDGWRDDSIGYRESDKTHVEAKRILQREGYIMDYPLEES